MKHAQNKSRFRRCLLALVGACVCAAGLPGAALAQDAPKADLSYFPDDDAVILKHLQHWTLKPDGQMVYEEHRWVQLQNDRAWRRYADPRVDYLEGQEEVELLAARTHLPDGTKLDSPNYAINVVTADGVSRWPNFAGWRQVAYTFSGVQNRAVLEWHYQRTSKPGVRRWLQADLRIGDVDPVIEQVVQVDLPPGQKLQFQLDRADRYVNFIQNLTDKGGMYRWEIANVRSDPDESHCPPWQERCGRLRFTNCPSADTWVAEILGAVESSAKPTEPIADFARDAAKDEVDETDKVRAICKKLRDTFSTVDHWQTWIGRHTRPVDAIYDSCYGSPLEAAALTLATLRSAGLDAQARIAVNRETFNERAPVDTDLAAIVIEVPGEAGPTYVEPSTGIVTPNGQWSDRDLLYVDKSKLQRFAFASDSSDSDGVRVRGQLVLGDDAKKLSGELTVELTGLFVDPEQLLTDDQKKSQVESMVGKVLPDMKVTDFSVSHLSQDRFVAHANVESKEDLKEVYSRRLITLQPDTPCLAEAHLPVNTSQRRTPIKLSGHLSEDVRVRIELPDGWKPAILPESLPPVSGPWGRITQMTDLDEDAVLLVRQMYFAKRVIEPEDFDTIRQAVRTLQSEAGRTLLVEKTE